MLRKRFLEFFTLAIYGGFLWVESSHRRGCARIKSGRLMAYKSVGYSKCSMLGQCLFGFEAGCIVGG